ncbi:MAG: cation-transporting P-type ATPase [Chromatiaceae bacterium]|nr:cation-transporting P-type ATPase [Chromatiaceae bacterium]
MTAVAVDERQIEVLHQAVPGRLRLRLLSLYRDRASAHQLAEELSGQPDIIAATANPLTGALLILHNRELDCDSILRRVSALLDALASNTLHAARPMRQSPKAQGLKPSVANPSASSPIRAIGKIGRLRRLLHDEPSRRATETISGFDPRHWHAMSPQEVRHALQVTDDGGLDTAEAARRLARFGRNHLGMVSGRSQLAMLLEQLLTAPVGLLAASALISVLTGGAADAAVILVVVGINSAIGWLTERQAEQTIRGLADVRPRHCQVRRDGLPRTAPIDSLVPGDLVELAPGSWVAADLRLLSSRELSIDESALTGESLAVTKAAGPVLAPETPVAERANMAFMGTVITGGTGAGLVVGTAFATELGRIQAMLGDVTPPQTPMETQLGRLGYQLALLSGLVCAGVFVAGLVRGLGWLPMLKSSVSLAVAAVPEGLPAVATSTLALGITRMRRQRVAVRHLDAVETLGSVQVLCLDKTGTLTQNSMAVQRLFLGTGTGAGVGVGVGGADATLAQSPVRRRLLEAVSLCSEVQIQADGELQGSATELALVRLAQADGIDIAQLRAAHPLIELHQRAEGRPVMSSFHRSADGGLLIAAKGSPNDLLERCTHLGDAETPLDEAARERLLRENDGMAADALRVLGVAYRHQPQAPSVSEMETRGLIWLGLVGLSDPLRPGMADLIPDFQQAGIKTVMITGDQSATAAAVGRELNLAAQRGDSRQVRVLDSSGIDRLDPAMLRGLVPDLDVFARVSPGHKLRIVQAFQQAGWVVAMTGDGINDSPALKAADTGIAMGQSGTDVARAVADLVLEDDNLHSMLEAVRQGRTIYADIRKTIHFLLATNFSEIEVMLVAILLGLGSPLNPMQLLWINLLSDIFPGLALSVEPAEADVMQQPPRDPAEPIVPRESLARMGVESAVISAAAMAAYGYGLARYGPGAKAGTLAFDTLTTAQLLHALSCRSEHPVFWGGTRLPPNRPLDLALASSLAVQVLANLVPGLRRLLGLAPLAARDLLVVLTAALLPLLINEALKPSSGRPSAAVDDTGAGERPETESVAEAPCPSATQRATQGTTQGTTQGNNQGTTQEDAQGAAREATKGAGQ